MFFPLPASTLDVNRAFFLALSTACARNVVLNFPPNHEPHVEAGSGKNIGTTSEEKLEGGGLDEEDEDPNIDKGDLQEDMASQGSGGMESEDGPQENDFADDQPMADKSNRNNKLSARKTRASKANPGFSSRPQSTQPKATTRSTQLPKPASSSKAAATKKSTSSRRNEAKTPDNKERLERICGYWYGTDVRLSTTPHYSINGR